MFPVALSESGMQISKRKLLDLQRQVLEVMYLFQTSCNFVILQRIELRTRWSIHLLCANCCKAITYKNRHP